MDIKLRVQYMCGCKEVVKSWVDIDLPDDPSEEVAAINLIEQTYDMSNWCCRKRHPFGYLKNFEKILEIVY